MQSVSTVTGHYAPKLTVSPSRATSRFIKKLLALKGELSVTEVRDTATMGLRRFIPHHNDVSTLIPM